ncbi:MAG: translation initiation factor IF-3 [Candidatus Vidania fulgoroideorum]
MQIKLINLDGTLNGLYSFSNAIKIAKNLNLDLIKINSKTNPKIYRLGNYKKFLYQKKKRKSKTNKKIKTKEINFKLNIFDNDYKTKIRKISFLLSKNIIVNINIKTYGRESFMFDRINTLINRIFSSLNLVRDLNAKVKKVGRFFSIFIYPNVKIKNK